MSQSVLVAPSRRCGVSSLVNSCGLYDYNNMQLVKELLRGGGDFIDIGANVGSYTLIAAEEANARVLAIEPHPITFQHLARNVERNAYRNACLVRAAVGAEDGVVTITNTPGSAATHITRDGSGMVVEIFRMDTLLAKTGFKPDVVKIDVEGFELGVLQGFGKRLDAARVLFVEMNDLGTERESDASQVRAILEVAGFLPPRFVDWRSRRLVRERVAIGEDPVCVHSSFASSLTGKHGFSIESGTSRGEV